MQAVRPAPPGHEPAGELVHDEDLAVLHHVLDVFFVQRMGLEQLMDDVQCLALRRVLRLDRAPSLDLLRGREIGIVLQLVHRVRDVRDDEQCRILRRHRLHALVGQVHGAAALVHHEIQIVLDVPHLLIAGGELAVGQPIQLDALHELLHTLLVEQLEELLVLRHAELRLVEQLGALVIGVFTRQQRLAARDEIVRNRGLPADELHDLGVVLGVLLVRLGAHGAGDDEGGAGLVDQNRIDLVDDRVDVPTLHPLLQRPHHVVAQVVESELVIRAVRDVAGVGRPALRTAGLCVIDASHRQAEPGEQMAHPLRVTPGEVVVDRDEVRAAASERVEIERQRRDERLALARRHLGDLALMQDDPADQLHIVGDHVPLHRVAGDHDLAAEQAARCFPHRRERLGEQIVERVLQLRSEVLLRRAQLVVQIGAFDGIGTVVLRLLQALDFAVPLTGALRDHLAEPRGLCLQLAVRDVLEAHFVLENRIHDRLDTLQLAVEPRPENLGEPPIGHYTLPIKPVGGDVFAHRVGH